MDNLSLQPLIEIMRRLRSPDGCPWDREQTHLSLRPYAIEEAYEVAEAAENGEIEALIDELGDLLLQVVFHGIIGEENKEFDTSHIIDAICNKMLRRHPHVFGQAKAANSSEVMDLWEEVKAQERKGKAKKSALDGITKGLPALMEANKLQSKAAKVGFDWPDIDGVWQKLKEEEAEVKEAIADQDKNPDAVEEEIGDLLFAVVNLARFLNVEPETALLKTNNKFKKRFHYMEGEAAARKTQLKELTLEQQETLWQEAKKK